LGDQPPHIYNQIDPPPVSAVEGHNPSATQVFLKPESLTLKSHQNVKEHEPPLAACRAGALAKADHTL